MEPYIRRATGADAPALLAIYTPYVLETAISFEFAPPSTAAFQTRIHDILQSYPFLVAQDGSDGPIVGYAYASSFKSREAYQWCAETSVYVAQDRRGQGWGGRLYSALLPILARQGIQKAYACITWPNAASIAFHERMGFVMEARFTRCGFKLGQWRDVVWMAKTLGEDDPPPPLRKAADVLREK